MKKLIFITSLIMGVSTICKAADDSSATSESRTQAQQENRKSGGGFVEPFLYGTQSKAALDARGLGAVDSTSDFREAGIGARLGGHIGDVVFLAADARYSRSGATQAFLQSPDSTSYNYGITLGAQTPWAGIRVWGTSVLGGEFNPSPGANNLDLKFGGANGYRVGAGLHIAAVSLNLEYQDIDYRTTTIENPGTTTISGVDARQRGYSLGLGFPIGL